MNICIPLLRAHKFASIEVHRMKFAKPHLYSVILALLAILLIIFVILFFNDWINHAEVGNLDITHNTHRI